MVAIWGRSDPPVPPADPSDGHRPRSQPIGGHRPPGSGRHDGRGRRAQRSRHRGRRARRRRGAGGAARVGRVPHRPRPASACPALVLGHEGAGVVAAVGRRASGRSRSATAWSSTGRIPCGSCFQCVEGNQHLCERHSPLTAGLGGHAHDGATRCAGQPVRAGVRAGHACRRTTLVRERGRRAAPRRRAVRGGVHRRLRRDDRLRVGRQRRQGRARLARSSCSAAAASASTSSRAPGSAGRRRSSASTPKPDRLDMATAVRRHRRRSRPTPADDELAGVADGGRGPLTGGRGADYAFECTAVPELGAAPLAMIRPRRARRCR